LPHDLELAVRGVVNKTRARRRFRDRRDVTLLGKFVQVFGKTILGHIKLLDGVIEPSLIDRFDRSFARLIDRSEVIDRSGQGIAAAVIREEILLFGFFFLGTRSKEQERESKGRRNKFHAASVANNRAASQNQFISDPVDGEQVFRLVSVVSDFLAQLDDCLVQGAGGAEVIVAPDIIKEFIAREDDSWRS
jgi:hypothetical protein